MPRAKGETGYSAEATSQIDAFRQAAYDLCAAARRLTSIAQEESWKTNKQRVAPAAFADIADAKTRLKTLD